MLINKNLFFPALFFLVSTSTVYADCTSDFQNPLTNWQHCLSQNFIQGASTATATVTSSGPNPAYFPVKIPKQLRANPDILNHTIKQQINTYQCKATATMPISQETSGGGTQYPSTLKWNLCADNIDKVTTVEDFPDCIINKSAADPEHAVNCLKQNNMDATITFVMDGQDIPTCGSSFSSPPAFCQQNNHLYYCYLGSNQINVIKIDGTHSLTATGHGVTCNDLLKMMNG